MFGIAPVPGLIVDHYEPVHPDKLVDALRVHRELQAAR
jgi:hypothetical protein